MYFLDTYDRGRFRPDRLDEVLKKAEAPSLDDVAWGAVYPDLIRLVFPLPLRADRGQAIEWAWTRNADVDRNLAEWRTDVWHDNRPANIFNATIAETGDRLLMGTTRVGGKHAWWRPAAGLRNFEDLYPDRDIRVVTAARLSASFTYVSPAARGDGAPAYHIVDGGYHDNYGMTTLTE